MVFCRYVWLDEDNDQWTPSRVEFEPHSSVPSNH